MNNPEEMTGQSEQTGNIESLPPEGSSWQNPGEFPSFRGEDLSLRTDKDAKITSREVARSEAEKQYQSELTRAYEIDKEDVIKFSIETDGEAIDGYEFVGADFKMLVSVIGQ